MRSKRALILLGGTWHDFDGFAKSMKQILEPEGWIVDATYDFEHMRQLDKKEYNLVVSYTCFSKQDWKGDPNVAEGFSDEQFNSLVKWVRSGGLFLASHAATIPGKTNPLLCEFIGGIFVEHPPECNFTVYPMYGKHSITNGIKSFTVHDELYIQKFKPSLNIHMIAIHNGMAYPMVWTKREGKGLIAHVALGHSPKVWELESYQLLMLQTVEWLTSKNKS
jgi:type 1 glutamine amidotransferase